MKTLLIYDNTGFIYVQMTGDYRKPEGLKHLEITIPDGKMIDSIKLDPKGDSVIFKDVPKSSLQLMQEQLETVQGALDALLMGGV
ncbi:hypothetical protein ACDZ28_03920 [Paenibacillus sp. RS8]|uniref:hypothetical protein n=1 Tax=Paenibacillus sp. RS8 TaxID=3242681 RepID=UPI0035BEDE26